MTRKIFLPTALQRTVLISSLFLVKTLPHVWGYLEHKTYKHLTNLRKENHNILHTANSQSNNTSLSAGLEKSQTMTQSLVSQHDSSKTKTQNLSPTFHHFDDPDFENTGAPAQIEAIWQPPHANTGTSKGIMFFAHGCGHQATDFFYQGPTPKPQAKAQNQQQQLFQNPNSNFDCTTSQRLGNPKASAKASNYASSFSQKRHSKLLSKTKTSTTTNTVDTSLPCLALPEERQLIEYARSNSLWVLAVSSSNPGGNGCWDNQADPKRVARALGKMIELEASNLNIEGTNGNNDSSNKIPLYVLGASSGGGFLSFLTKELVNNPVAVFGPQTQLKLDLKCVVPQIMNLSLAQSQYLDSLETMKRDYGRNVKTVYVHMGAQGRDEGTGAQVKSEVGLINDKFKPDSVSEPMAKEILISPSPLRDELVEHYRQEAVEQIEEALGSNGLQLLDGNGLLVADPRQTFHEIDSNFEVDNGAMTMSMKSSQSSESSSPSSSQSSSSSSSTSSQNTNMAQFNSLMNTNALKSTSNWESGLVDRMIGDKSKLRELMNVSWAMHEITAKRKEEVFQFCGIV